MAVTVVTNPNQSVDNSPKAYFGLSGDSKPTIASPGDSPPPPQGSTFKETDTGDTYSTADGTTWVLQIEKGARSQAGLLNSGVKTGDAQIKSGAGEVYWISVSDTAALVIDLEDAIGSGTSKWGINLPADGYGIFIFDPPIEFATGIYLDVDTATCKVTVGYK